MLSSVLTTCAVFIPLVFVKGMAGALFYDQAMSITIVLLTSYVVTVTVIPVYYWLWYRGQPAFRATPVLAKYSVHGPMMRMEERCVNWFIRHSSFAWSILGVSFVGIVICFMFMPKSQLPEMTYDETIVHIDWNEQVSLEENVARVSAMEAAVGGCAEQVTSMIGIQQFILGHSGDIGSSEASVYIKCDGAESLAKAQEIASEYMSAYKSASWSFSIAGNIFDMVFGNDEPELVARLRPVSSPELEPGHLQSAVDDIRAALSGVHVADVKEKTDMLFVADPDLMALYGISYSEMISVLKNAMNQNRLFTIVQGTRTLPVITGSDRRSLWETLSGTYIKDVPVLDLVRQTYVRDLKTIVSGMEGNYYPLELDIAQRDVAGTMASVRNALKDKGDFEVSFSGFMVYVKGDDRADGHDIPDSSSSSVSDTCVAVRIPSPATADYG